jgi:hypothetical protein
MNSDDSSPDLDFDNNSADGDALDDEELDALFALVRQAFEEGDPSPSADDRGISYVRWLAPDADLGVMFEIELTGVRDDSDETDEVEFVGVLVRVAASISPYRIVGEVSPWSGGTVQLEHEQGTIDVDVDDDGSFYIASPPAGPLRLRVMSAPRELVTEWFAVSPGRSS